MKTATVNGAIIQGRSLEEMKDSAAKWKVIPLSLVETIWNEMVNDGLSSCTVIYKPPPTYKLDISVP